MMTLAKPLTRSTPEAQGILSSGIRAFLDAVESNNHEFHSFMIVRNGHVVAEGWWPPYGKDLPHILHSLSKSFCSTAAGLAIDEGHFSLDDKVISFFPDDLPETVSENLAAMRVRDLLTMSTGQAKEPTSRMAENWVRDFLSAPVEHAPGAPFVYNSAATYMVSAIVQKTTGMTVLEWLEPRLLAPLGIVGATWESCPRGINTGGWGMSVKTEDIAKFGQLYLQRGMWNGERLVPEAWIDEATSKQVSNGTKADSDWEQGYGFQFWRCRHGAYRGDGAFGQFCVVMPEQNTVVAITAGLGDMHAELRLVWDHLLPAMAAHPVPEDHGAHSRLLETIAGLALRAPEGAATSPIAAEVSGKTYVFPKNDQKLESVVCDFGNGGCALTLRDDKGEHVITCGHEDWVAGSTAFTLPRPYNVVARGAWITENTYAAKLCFNETSNSLNVSCQFLEDRMLFDCAPNVAFGGTRREQLEGTAEVA